CRTAPGNNGSPQGYCPSAGEWAGKEGGRNALVVTSLQEASGSRGCHAGDFGPGRRPGAGGEEGQGSTDRLRAVLGYAEPDQPRRSILGLGLGFRIWALGRNPGGGTGFLCDG